MFVGLFVILEIIVLEGVLVILFFWIYFDVEDLVGYDCFYVEVRIV